jgi:hypothetical protein
VSPAIKDQNLPASSDEETPLFDWGALLPVHPAVELFPPLSEAELKELAEDTRPTGCVFELPCGGRTGGIRS